VAENGNAFLCTDLYLFEVKKPSEMEEAVGLLQTARGGARRQGVLHAEEAALPADEVSFAANRPSPFRRGRSCRL
jgi:hypothetical protein